MCGDEHEDDASHAHSAQRPGPSRHMPSPLSTPLWEAGNRHTGCWVASLTVKLAYTRPKRIRISIRSLRGTQTHTLTGHLHGSTHASEGIRSDLPPTHTPHALACSPPPSALSLASCVRIRCAANAKPLSYSEPRPRQREWTSHYNQCRETISTSTYVQQTFTLGEHVLQRRQSSPSSSTH